MLRLNRVNDKKYVPRKNGDSVLLRNGGKMAFFTATAVRNFTNVRSFQNAAGALSIARRRIGET
jgi:hypothetical protein